MVPAVHPQYRRPRRAHFLGTAIVSAEVRVFSCEPEWAALAKEIGGDLVEAYAATTALQDPHYIQARPSLIARVRQADLVICSGAQLEIGWLPALLQKANNRRVMPGGDGYLEASSFVLRLDATGRVDRSQGDIHPLGNPHIQTDARNVLAVARALSARLAKLDSTNTSIYENNLKSFITQWTAPVSDRRRSARTCSSLAGAVNSGSTSSLDGGARALGSQGGAAARQAHHYPPQILGLPGALARSRGGCEPRGHPGTSADSDSPEPPSGSLR